MIPLAARLTIVFVAGLAPGSLVNWAIYALAWRPRPISPWSRLAPGASPRGRLDRVPVIGWFALRREAQIHGPRFWIRPLLLELFTRRGSGRTLLVGNRAAGSGSRTKSASPSSRRSLRCTCSS